MKKDIVFIGGVHGVGKSYFCNLLADRYDIEHVTASSLIGKHIRQSKYKTVQSITNNQVILAKELSKFRTNHQMILLDGHFCLLDKKREIKKIPLETFEEIAPKAIILLIDNPTSIYTRISDRDGKKLNEELITALQKCEIKNAKYISRTLNVPLVMVNHITDTDQMINVVSTYFEK